MLPATVPGAASQVAPAEAARIAAVLRAALSGATIRAYALRLTTYAAWAAATGRPWNHTLTLLAFLSRPACIRTRGGSSSSQPFTGRTCPWKHPMAPAGCTSRAPRPTRKRAATWPTLRPPPPSACSASGALPEDRIFAMSARTIANRIKAAAGIEGRFAGHSGRVGRAQDLATRGAVAKYLA